MKKHIAILFIFIMILSMTAISYGEEEPLYYLWSRGCTVCDSTGPFLEELEREYGVTVVAYEVNEDKELFNRKLGEHNLKTVALPVFIYKDKVWSGFNPQFESEIKEYISTNKIDAAGSLQFYSFNFEEGELLLPTIIIGSIDGLNPCSIWALMALISMVVGLGSRKKMLLVGGSYIAVIALIYGLYIVGVFGITVSVLDILWLRLLIFLIALFFAMVTIKDFFTNKGISLGISTQNKDKFIQRVEKSLLKELSPLRLVAATIIIALFASLVELPCTAGFPIIWNGILAQQGIGKGQYFMLLALYLLMYVLIELVIVIAAAITLKRAQMNFKIAMGIKLVSGCLMIFLGALLLLGSKYINNMGLITIGSAVVIATSGIFAYVYTYRY